MEIKHANIFYVRNIHAIGGVETYVYELAKKYKDYDIAVVKSFVKYMFIQMNKSIARLLLLTGIHLYLIL